MYNKLSILSVLAVISLSRVGLGQQFCHETLLALGQGNNSDLAAPLSRAAQERIEFLSFSLATRLDHLIERTNRGERVDLEVASEIQNYSRPLMEKAGRFFLDRINMTEIIANNRGLDSKKLAAQLGSEFVKIAKLTSSQKNVWLRLQQLVPGLTERRVKTAKSQFQNSYRQARDLQLELQSENEVLLKFEKEARKLEFELEIFLANTQKMLTTFKNREQHLRSSGRYPQDQLAALNEILKSGEEQVRGLLDTTAILKTLIGQVDYALLQNKEALASLNSAISKEINLAVGLMQTNIDLSYQGTAKVKTQGDGSKANFVGLSSLDIPSSTLELLFSRHEPTQVQGIRAMANLPSQSVNALLLKTWLQSGVSPTVRMFALQTLKNRKLLNQDEFLPELELVLSSQTDFQTKNHIADILKSINSEKALAVLQKNFGFSALPPSPTEVASNSDTLIVLDSKTIDRTRADNKASGPLNPELKVIAIDVVAPYLNSTYTAKYFNNMLSKISNEHQVAAIKALLKGKGIEALYEAQPAIEVLNSKFQVEAVEAFAPHLNSIYKSKYFSNMVFKISNEHQVAAIKALLKGKGIEALYEAQPAIEVLNSKFQVQAIELFAHHLNSTYKSKYFNSMVLKISNEHQVAAIKALVSNRGIVALYEAQSAIEVLNSKFQFEAIRAFAHYLDTTYTAKYFNDMVSKISNEHQVAAIKAMLKGQGIKALYDGQATIVSLGQ
jgi:hypothetical protein